MLAYDPLAAPDPEAWQSMDEGERLALVETYHRRVGDEPPNEQVHAIVHVIVENQVVLGDEIPVAATLERLMGEGLDRHDAVHAIGAILMGHLQAVLDAGDDAPDINEGYYAELAKLTAAGWIEEFS